MKSYTDIEQSKVLEKILPAKSADMMHDNLIVIPFNDGSCTPCWSLAALLGVLPKSLIYTPNQALDGYCCKNIMHDLETYGDNPVDACVDMINKLHEQKIL